MNQVYKHIQFNENNQLQIKTKGNPGINMGYEVSSPKRKYINVILPNMHLWNGGVLILKRIVEILLLY